MRKEEKKMMRRRLANAYVSSIISISMVLLLVGIAALLIVNAQRVANYFKENMQISVILRQDVQESAAEKYLASVQTLPYTHSARLVSREEGTAELKELLGEDFLNVFETSPVPLSIEMTLVADYVSADSLEIVRRVLTASPLVDEVNSQQSLIEVLNANLTRISLLLGVFILLMLFISFVLINNTVRLNVYARRFTVHTMKLVGATRSFIRGPFLVRAVFQGLIAALLSLAILGGLLYLLKRSFAQLFAIIDTRTLVLVAGVVLATGVLICVISTFFVVNKLVSQSKDNLYY